MWYQKFNDVSRKHVAIGQKYVDTKYINFLLQQYKYEKFNQNGAMICTHSPSMLTSHDFTRYQK